MCCFECLNEKLKKLTVCDLGIMKVSAIAFALLVAKLWPAALALDWGWYAGIFGITYIYLLCRIFIKK